MEVKKMFTSKPKVERVRHGLTQADLAEKARMPKYRYAFFEKGIMKLNEAELRRISEVLGIEITNPF